MFKKIDYSHAVRHDVFQNKLQKRIVAVLPAHNERDSIKDTLDSLRNLIVPSGLELDLFVALDNCTDDTENVLESNSDGLNVYALTTVDNKERKVGALNQIYRLFFGNMSETAEPLAKKHIGSVNNIVAYLGIDADIYLEKHALTILYDEINEKHNIGGVSANYTCLLPESKKRLLKDDPNADEKINSGKFGGPIARFITMQQNKSFSEWTIQQKHDGHQATILGGQATLFRPKALREVYDKLRLNGIYDNSTDTEDLLLTQHLRSLGWQCKISRKARCYVDSMKTMKSYSAQALKWRVGKLDYMSKAGISTAYSRFSWIEELTLWSNGITRIALIILIPAAILLGNFTYNWIFLLPILFSMILNTIVVIKTPNKRFIDVLLSATTISSEFAIWFDFITDIKSWHEISKIERKDTWASQYQAESGVSSKLSAGWLSIIVIALLVGLGLYFKLITLNSALQTIKPYINRGFDILIYLVIFNTVLMVRKLFKMRGGFKA